MAPPNTYRKISRNSAPWTVPSTTSCGVRRNLSRLRLPITSVLATSLAERRVTLFVVVMVISFCSGCSGRRVGGVVVGGAAGEGQEDLVQLREPERDVVDHHAGRLQRPQRDPQPAGPGRGGDAHAPGRLLDLRPAVVQLR